MTLVGVYTGPNGVEFYESIYTMSDSANDVILVTLQMSLKQGLATFGRRGEDAVGGELKQVHNMKGFIPRHHAQLSRSERLRALRYLMYLKEKRNGTIKTCGCADGRKQCLWTDKCETSLPTVALGSLILTCVIDAHENRRVGSLDVLEAFLQTSMDGEEKVHILLEGRMAGHLPLNICLESQKMEIHCLLKMPNTFITWSPNCYSNVNGTSGHPNCHCIPLHKGETTRY